MTPMTTQTDTDAGFVEVLTTKSTGEVYGYRLTGAAPGPVLVAAGHCDAAEALFERIMRIPTLPWMRGTLVLIRLGRLDVHTRIADDLVELGPVDRTIVLPFADHGEASALELRRTYHNILRTCADLGMISARGVGRALVPEAS